jgi:hypothetical protein
MQNPSLSPLSFLSSLPAGKTINRHMPLLVLLLLLALLLWPTEETGESSAEGDGDPAAPKPDGAETASAEARLPEAA